MSLTTLRLFFLLVVGTLLTTCQGQSTHDCPFGAQRHAPGDRCGFLTVPANRSRPDGPRLEMAYLVLRSASPDRQPDPVVFIQGGPGASVLPYVENFRRFNPDPDRDFVLFDARGTGYSGVLCPDLGPGLISVLAADIAPAEEAEHLRAASNTCREQLRERGLSLADYNTREMAADLEDLRRHLGYTQWNLFGGSYGTRLGLIYLDEYPEFVRSALLLGVFPPQVRMYDRLATNFDAALQRVFTACAEDADCRDRYPDLAGALSIALAQLQDQPLTYTWRDQNFALNAQDFLLFLHQQLYDRRTIGRIPALITAVRDRETEPLIAATTAVFQRLQIIDLATYWSVMAGDEGSFANSDKIAADLARVPAYGAGIGFFLSDPAMLRTWREGTAPFTELEAVRSDVPTLLVSGAFDPITPPANAEAAATELSHSHTVVFANEGHTPFTPCFFELARRFFQDPETAPDPSCAAVGSPIGWQ